MRDDKYWKYGCFVIGIVLLGVSIYIAWLDELLRKYCNDVPQTVQYSLYIFILLAAIYLLYTACLWAAARPTFRQAIKVTVIIICMYAAFSGMYLRYHNEVFQKSSHQTIYKDVYDKGLWYGLGELFY